MEDGGDCVRVGGETESIRERASLVCNSTVPLKEIGAYAWQH